MDKKKPTDEELRVFLLGLAGGLLVGGLVASCAEVFLIGWLFYFGSFGWSVFKEVLQTKRNHRNRPL